MMIPLNLSLFRAVIRTVPLWSSIFSSTRISIEWPSYIDRGVINLLQKKWSRKI